jgi:hypothetical protein
LASPEIFFEFGRIRAVYIYITVEITIAGISIGTGVKEGTSAKIQLKGSSIGSVAIQITIEIAFTLTCIAAIVSSRWIVVILKGVVDNGAIIFFTEIFRDIRISGTVPISVKTIITCISY